MKIQMTRDVVGNFYDANLTETWDKPLHRWDELNAEGAGEMNNYAVISLTDGNVLAIPLDSFKVMS